MIRTLAFFVLSLSLAAPVAIAQQTSPSPATDTTKTATKRPVFTLKTLRVQPLYVFEINDNAKIDADHQFPGIRPAPDSCHYNGERHLSNLRQLTFEGRNMRPSLSPDGRYVVFQAHGTKPNSCDQVYRVPIATGVPAGRISSGLGLATGGAFLSEDTIVYSSTAATHGGACPEGSSRALTSPWTIENGSDLYLADSNGKEISRITDDSAHFAGLASVSQNGQRVLVTGTRSGDAEIFTVDPRSSAVSQLTHSSGFNGDASYSPYGNEIVFSGWHPTGPSLAAFRNELKEGSAEPPQLELFVMNADGTNIRQITHLGGLNGSPSWSPDGEHIIFCSNHLDPKGQRFDLFLINADGTGLERITRGGSFNGFPVFTEDGKQLIFCSSRNATHSEDVNIFVADWVP